MFKNKLIFILIAFTFIMSECGKKVEEKEIIRPVRYMQAYVTGGSRVRTFTGVAQAGVESRLSFKVPGTVQRINVMVGDDVRAGQLIAQLDRNDYQLQVQQAEAALSQAEAQERNARASYDRVRVLYENESASKSDLDAARAANESAGAGLKAAEKQLEMAKLQLSYTRLTAPASGSIASVMVEANENVSAGQPIVMLTDGSEIEVRMSIPEILISRIIEGDDVEVSFDALPDRSFEAKITEVGVASVGAGTTYPVIVKLNRHDTAIRPGMAATVACNFESPDERERFVIPSHAIAEDRKGRFVFTVVPMTDDTNFGIIHRKEVTIGDLTPEGIEVFDGLEEGDLVVTAGVSRISEGMKVRL